VTHPPLYFCLGITATLYSIPYRRRGGSPVSSLCIDWLKVAKLWRQVPFDCFVADFYCHAAKLVIELDGKQHEWFADYDAGRTEILERLGIRVSRFTNAQARDDLDAVLARIRAELRLPFDSSVRSPHACPSSDGRGERCFAAVFLLSWSKISFAARAPSAALPPYSLGSRASSARRVKKMLPCRTFSWPATAGRGRL
jgi:very-short-patch-repair endonuclease